MITTIPLQAKLTMTKTALHLTDEEIARYRAAARGRKAQAEQDRRQRKQQAQLVTRRAAAVLKDRFGAGPVMLFGSLARDDFFHHRSDIDLAAAGLQARDFWRAWKLLEWNI